MVNPCLCSLSSLQKNGQQEDSEEEEEENAPQSHGSSETWRQAASFHSPRHHSCCLHEVTRAPLPCFCVFVLFIFLFLSNFCLLSVTLFCDRYNAGSEIVHATKLTSHFNISLRIHFPLSWALPQTHSCSSISPCQFPLSSFDTLIAPSRSGHSVFPSCIAADCCSKKHH